MWISSRTQDDRRKQANQQANRRKNERKEKQMITFILLFTNNALIFREWSLKIHHDKRHRKPLVTEEQDTSRESKERVMSKIVPDDKKHSVLVGFCSDSSVGAATPQVELEECKHSTSKTQVSPHVSYGQDTEKSFHYDHGCYSYRPNHFYYNIIYCPIANSQPLWDFYRSLWNNCHLVMS